MLRFEPFCFYKNAFKNVFTRQHPRYVVFSRRKPLVTQDGLNILHWHSIFSKERRRQMSNCMEAEVVTGAEVSQETRTDNMGRKNIRVIIGDAAASQMVTAGSSLDKATRARFGIQPQATRR